MRSWFLTPVLAVTCAAGLAAQTSGAKPAAPATQKPAAATQKPAAPRPAAASGVDTVLALVKAGLPEAAVIAALQAEGRAYKLAPADLLKLTQAGVSANIISAMTGGGGAAAPAAASTATPAVAAGGVTPFPPDLADSPASSRKRRMAVSPFDYSTVMSWVQYWFNQPYNIGDGIRAMLTTRMAQSNTITLLEREKIQEIMKEQDFTASNRVRQGTGAKIGQISGADVNLYGDIVIFGRDDTTKRKSAGAIAGRLFGGVVGGAVTGFSKEEKAVVGITLRLVDTETGEVIETAEARGESSRTSKDFSGVLGGAGAGVGAVAGGSSGMTSSNFQNTIIGEATSNSVTKVVEFLEGRVPKLPAKPRAVEGRVAVIGAGQATLAVGSNDGVLRGDRFEILQINGEIRDPATKEVIDIDAVKIGELVVDTVRDRTASGAYGGQPLSAAIVAAAGKGYAARLMR
jgi:curli biogenesis system outer membrane secretion channel CsgG